MMKIYRNCEKGLNSSESFMGEFHFIYKNLIIPFYNLNVTQYNDHEEIKKFEGMYVDFSFIVFRDVESLVLDEKQFSKLIKDYGCYGGADVSTSLISEFLIRSEQTDLVVLDSSEFSKRMHPFDAKIVKTFFIDQYWNYIREICKEYLQRR